MSKIYILGISLALATLVSPMCHSHLNEHDSTEVSTIDFVKMEATLSSKIIHFKWQVDAEKQGDHFLIEKSIDRHVWVGVARVKSLKNHHERHTYLISEINFVEGAHEYFRIKRVDQNGIVSVLDEININQPVLSRLYVIPVSGKGNKKVIVSCNSLISSKGKLSVYRRSGELVAEKKVQLSEGYNRVILNMKKFDNGNYMIILKDEFENKLTKSVSKGRKALKNNF